MKEIEAVRKIGLILAKVGSGWGLVSPIYLLVLLIRKCEESALTITFGPHTFLGGFLSNSGIGSSGMLAILLLSQLFFVLLGVLGIVYDGRDSKMAGILLIVAGVGFALTSGSSYFVATPLLLAAGILLLLQKREELKDGKRYTYQ